MTRLLWTPSPETVSSCAMTRFRHAVNDRYRLALGDDRQLHQWSVDHYPEFWDMVWDFCVVIGDKGDRTVENPDRMTACRFFPDAALNYAENLLNGGQQDDAIAFHFRGEDKIKRQMDFATLRAQVSQFRQFLIAQGVESGDRVAAFMPNIPETIIAMLAATSLGAVWSSASPDFGVQAVLDRFGQIEPKILLAIDGYYYNGKWVDCRAKLEEIIPNLVTLRHVVHVAYDPQKASALPDAGNTEITAYNAILSRYAPEPLQFKRLPFNHPLYIMFSSGTTGKPKCIVHGAGGTLLQHKKEHLLHCDERAGDNVFYYTTCGWMMWNWQVSALSCGVTLSLYDGSPFYPDGNVLMDYADEAGITLFGTASKYIDTLHKQGYKPIETHKLDTVRLMTSTGSVLVPESFDYIYRDVKKDIQLSGISGGTDIVSCFMLGYPSRAVYRGELQGAGLGMAVNVYSDDGKPVAVGEKGELVCEKPFPSMPVGFWNDPDNARYHAAYFQRFPDVWHHGDYIEKTAHDGYIIYGRSDATLNPGGVRIGTAEIYRQVEQLPEILESIVVGQRWQEDERVILFVRLQEGVALDDALVAKIRSTIRTGASPRHVPAKIIAVRDIPRTKNNKISEIAVRDIISGKNIANTDALANPEALDEYRNLPELQSS